MVVKRCMVLFTGYTPPLFPVPCGEQGLQLSQQGLGCVLLTPGAAVATVFVQLQRRRHWLILPNRAETSRLRQERLTTVSASPPERFARSVQAQCNPLHQHALAGGTTRPP